MKRARTTVIAAAAAVGMAAASGVVLAGAEAATPIGATQAAATVSARASAALAAGAPASTRGSQGAANRARKPRHPAKQPKVLSGRVLVRGVVLAHTATKVKVLVSAAAVGPLRFANQVLTIQVGQRGRSGAARTRRPTQFGPGLADGYRINLGGRGTLRRSTISLRELSHEDHQAAAATAWFGSLTSVDAGANSAALLLSDETCGGDSQEHGHSSSTVTVDYSTAVRNNAITVDGQPGNLAAGQFVVVLGEASDLTVLAETVYAFTARPAAIRGEIRAIVGTSVSLGEDENATTIDLGSGPSATPLVLNGNGGATVDQLNRGDKILIIGSTDGSTFRPALAIAFNEHDTGPVGDNED